MQVRLMLTCLCDAFFGEVGIATVRVLEHVGCSVVFDERQTCCGQPPFNAGDWASAGRIARHNLTVLCGAGFVVTPSASCAAMVREGYHLMGGLPAPPETYELTEFLHQVVKVQSWPSLLDERRVGLHRSCHGRALKLGETQEAILEMVGNLIIEPFGEADQCCGFGGAFSVTHGQTSRQIGLSKLQEIRAAGIDEVVSGDMGCLMHLQCLAAAERIPVKFTHIAEVLASAI